MFHTRSTFVLSARAGVLLLLVGIGVGACGDPRESRHAEPDNRAPAVPRELTTAEWAQLRTAEQVLIQRCMRTRGFEYALAPAVRIQPDVDSVLTDVGRARRYGYGSDLNRRFEAAMRANPNNAIMRKLSVQRRTAALEALNGAPQRGIGVGVLTAELPTGGKVHRSGTSCTSSAERELYRDLPAWYRATKITENLGGLRYGLVQNDSRFSQAVVPWARCMRAAGEPYATPEAARAAVPTTGANARTTEIRIAVAEATCARSTQLGTVARNLATSADRMLEQRYRADVSARRRLARSALPRAQELVDTSGARRPMAVASAAANR
jgi:hypothetical protein